MRAGVGLASPAAHEKRSIAGWCAGQTESCDRSCVPYCMMLQNSHNQHDSCAKWVQPVVLTQSSGNKGGLQPNEKKPGLPPRLSSVSTTLLVGGRVENDA